MESYSRVTGIPNNGALQRGYTHPSRPSSSSSSSRSSHNGAGSYGLSIRVQGIDGHPYVVLNNQDRGPAPPPPPQPHVDPNGNGYVDAEGSFIDNYHEYDFRGGGAKGSRSSSPFTEYRSQSKHNGVTADSNGRKSSATAALLNFQRHPEILQPYDPERNSLAMDGYHSLPSRPSLLPPAAPADNNDDDDSNLQRVSSSSPASAGSSSPDQSRVPAPQQQQTKTTRPLPKSQPEMMAAAAPSKPQAQPARPPQSSSSSQAQPETEARVQHAPPQSKPQHAQVAQPQTKPHQSAAPPPQSKPAPPPSPQPQQQPITTPLPPQPRQQPITPLPPQPRQRSSAPSEPPSSSSATTPPASIPTPAGGERSSSSSAGSSLERTTHRHRHGEPDVLPLRRTDSSGPVLQTTTSWSSRSRHSSSSSTNTRTPQDADASLETLYAETINRHQNRRYIPFHAGTGRDIDTGSTPGVDELIDKFDGSKDGGSAQRRGRTGGRRSRINADDRKRSRSVDSALPFGLRGEGTAYMDDFSRRQGTCMEHVLRPSQLRMQKTLGSQDSWASTVEGKAAATRTPAGATASAPGSPQSTISTGVGSIQGYKKPLSRSSTLPESQEGGGGATTSASSAPGRGVTNTASPSSLAKPSSSSSAGTKPGTTEVDAQVTPDLLKGQQELSQQTHEETAKLILFNYLKDGSSDNDDSTKRKVNLVFEKIQTLKSRATTTTTTPGSLQGDNHSPDMSVQTKALQEQKAGLEETVAQMRKQLEEHVTSQKGLRETQGKMSTEVKDLEQQLRRSEEDCSRLRDELSKTEAELQTTLEELFQVKMEREQYQTEIRDLQDQLSEMHDELDAAKKSAGDGGEREAIMEELVQMKVDLQEVLMAKEDQEEVLRRRERELTALKGALKEEVATHDQEVDRLREQYDAETGRLRAALEEAKQTYSPV